MDSKLPEKSVLDDIEQWYKARCNGQWEHHYGITIESTDNPGWLATIGDAKVDKKALVKIIERLLTDYDSQVMTDGQMVRIFSSTFTGCINSLAIILELIPGSHE